MQRPVLIACLASVPLILGPPAAPAAESVTHEQAAAALAKAVSFFHERVSAHGSYVWRYSEDLALREGEGAATTTMGWVQPPGTPSVGEAFLTAYERTGDQACLDAAVAAAHSLVETQLASGGWDYRQEFDPAARKKNFAYRVDDNPGGKNNTSTLDDETSQAAIRLLMRVDRALGFKDETIHEATQFALDRLLKVQYPNGAWPQRFRDPPDHEAFPVRKASYPAEWPRVWPAANYSSYYTLNDGTLADCIALLFEAAEIYGEERYAAAARKGGDFLLLAQMPEPQPAWCQQYNPQMQPAWARKFEPPAVTGGESQGAIEILLEVYRHTGDKKYLAPLPRALAYLEQSELPGGRMARFYELKTNRPLFFTRQYELVYTADDLPTHYGFITGSKVSRLQAEYEKLLAADAGKLRRPRQTAKYELSKSLSAAARAAIDALDDRGAWVESGSLKAADSAGRVKRIITTQTFIKNLDTLSRFLAATAEERKAEERKTQE